jgi:hypothetical protein
MKGFAITLDAVIALSFLLFAIMLISSQTYQPRAPGGIYLKQLTLDTITVLEKTGRIDQALSGNQSGMDAVIEATPELACTRIDIIDQKGDIVASAEKSGCAESTSQDIQTSARPLLYEGAMYIIKSESWSRKESD